MAVVQTTGYAGRSGVTRDVGGAPPSCLAVEVSRLRREFWVEGSSRPLIAVHDIDLRIPQGLIAGVVGESGSGKSTLGYCLSGYLRPTSGSIKIMGEEIVGRADTNLSSLVEMAFQDAFESLDPRWTIGQSLREAAHASGADDPQILQTLKSVGVDPDILGRRPAEIPSGAQKVVNLIRAVLAGARVIIADEPTSGLDLYARRHLASALRVLSRETGLTILLISHDLPFVRYLAHLLFVMYLGDVVESGVCEGIFEDPMHPYSRALIAASRREDTIRLSGEIPSPTDRIEGCPLASRCPFAEDVCWTTPQPLIGRIDHKWACWKAEGIKKSGVVRDSDRQMAGGPVVPLSHP